MMELRRMPRLPIFELRPGNPRTLVIRQQIVQPLWSCAAYAARSANLSGRSSSAGGGPAGFAAGLATGLESASALAAGFAGGAGGLLCRTGWPKRGLSNCEG